MTNQQKLFLH